MSLTSDSSQKDYNSLPQSILVLVVKWRHHAKEILSVCLVNWPAILVVSVSQGRNYHCVRTHFVGLTLLNCYPTFLLRKEGAGASKTTVSVLRAKFFLYALRKLVSWLMFKFCPTPEARLRNLWCLSGPAEKIVPLISSVRTRLNLWLTELSIVFVCFGRVRLAQCLLIVSSHLKQAACYQESKP